MQYQFENIVVDPERREITRGSKAITPGPQVFDLLVHLVRNRELKRSGADASSQHPP